MVLSCLIAGGLIAVRSWSVVPILEMETRQIALLIKMLLLDGDLIELVPCEPELLCGVGVRLDPSDLRVLGP